MKKNKACIPLSFLAKADEGTVQYAFYHANNFTVVHCSKEKQEGRLPVHYAFRKKERRGYWKRRNKCVLQPGKGGVDNHDQMCSLYNHGKKNKPLAKRPFYGIIDSAALNAFDIFTENVPNFENIRKRSDKNSGRNWPLL